MDVLDEGQFAHLSVEDDDDSNQEEEDLMAGFGIEVESEGGLLEDGEDGGFNEADFKLF